MIQCVWSRCLLFGLLLSQACLAQSHGSEIVPWLNHEEQVALSKVFANISRSDAAPGSVVAAPSRENPNYYFHWIRDASLTMETLATLYQNTDDATLKARLKTTLMQFVDFSRQNQLTPTLTGLGEPKFNVNGSAFNDKWGRPQNDGPALRAIALIRFARQLLAENQVDYVRARLYDGKAPTQTVIKADLEYVSHQWQAPSYDIWEEVKGDHFFTRFVQRRALIEGASLARQLGDPGAATWYQSQADSIRDDMGRFWDGGRGYIDATLDRVDGLASKVSDLDSAVILGVLEGEMGDGFLDITDDRVMSTFQRLINTFAGLYPINRGHRFPGVAIGRYPEDVYGGSDFSGGNPWVLITDGFGEAFYRMAEEFGAAGKIAMGPGAMAALAPLVPGMTMRPGETIGSGDPRFKTLIDAMKREGDQYLLCVRAHENPDGALYEQIQRQSGFMVSAPDLTWSYVSLLRAAFARRGAYNQ